MDINLDPQIVSELEFLVKLHNKFGAPNTQHTVEELIATVLRSIAEGSRRPGSWERQILENMGIVPDCVAAQVYRTQ